MNHKLHVVDVTEVWAYRLRGTWRVEAGGAVVANGRTLSEALRAAAEHFEGLPARHGGGPQAQPATSTWLKASDVAARLQVSVRAVQDLLNSGALRGVRIGKLWRVDEAAYEEFAAQLRAGPTRLK